MGDYRQARAGAIIGHSVCCPPALLGRKKTGGAPCREIFGEEAAELKRKNACVLGSAKALNNREVVSCGNGEADSIGAQI